MAGEAIEAEEAHPGRPRLNRAGDPAAVGGDVQRSSELRLQQSWTANAAAWAEAVREGRIESRRLGTDRALLEAVTSRAPGRLLDVGCGEGWLARALAPHGFEVVGIDGSEELIASAEELGGGTFQFLGYEQLTSRPDLVAGPFDSVVCNFSLLSESLTAVLRALADRLTPDGELIVQTVHPFVAAGDEPYRDGWREEVFEGFGDGFTASMPWFYRTMGSWVRELRAAGLGLVDCIEPLHPQTTRPLSLILIARRAHHD